MTTLTPDGKVIMNGNVTFGPKCCDLNTLIKYSNKDKLPFKMEEIEFFSTTDFIPFGQIVTWQEPPQSGDFIPIQKIHLRMERIQHEVDPQS
jgi:hypothetical protein